METKDMANIANERGKEVGKLLKGGAEYEIDAKGKERLSVTTEQTEKARDEMNVDVERGLKRELKRAVKRGDWKLVVEIGEKLNTGVQESPPEEETLQIESEPGEVLLHKWPIISNYKNSELSVENFLIYSGELDGHKEDVKKIRETLQEVKNMLGKDVSSSYKLTNLTVEELSIFSKYLRDFYNPDGTKKEDFKKQIDGRIRKIAGYQDMPGSKRSQNPNNKIRFYNDEFYNRHKDGPYKNRILEFRNPEHHAENVGYYSEEFQESLRKDMAGIISRDMRNSNKDFGAFVDEVFNGGKRGEEEKDFIITSAFFEVSRKRFSEEQNILLRNAEEIFNFSKRSEILENTPSESLVDEIRGNVEVLRNNNTGAIREALDKSIKEYMGSISYTS